MTRFLGGLIVGAVAALALGYQLWRVAPVVERPLPEARQPDGSVVIERAPDPSAKPAHQFPKGTTLERVVSVTVQPRPRTTNAIPIQTDSVITESENPTRVENPGPLCTCDPVHVDLSLIRLKDGTRRFVASARGDSIIAAIDIPVETPTPTRRLRWAAGATRDVMSGRWGGYLARDFDRLLFLRIPYQAQVMHMPGPQGGLVAVGVGIRF